MAWGNLNGIRVDGHLFELNSSMCVVQPDGSVFTTGRERQTNSYSRRGKIETVNVAMRGRDWTLNGKEVVEETGTGAAKMDILFAAPKESAIGGAYWCLDLPQFSAVLPPGSKTVEGLHYTSGRNELEIAFDAPAEVESN